MDSGAKIKKIVKLSVPSVFSFFLEFSLELINLLYVGSESTELLDAIGLGNIIGVGLGSGLDTLCSQAYGAQNYPMVGFYLQRALYILTIVSIPISIAWLNTENILLFFGNNPFVSKQAGHYLIALIPGLWFLLAFDAIRRFLQGQNLFWPGMLITGVTTLLHFGWCYLLIDIVGFKAAGVGLATSITYFLDFIMAIILIKVLNLCPDTWTGLNFQQATTDIKEYLIIAVPAMLMYSLEFWDFSITQLIAGQFGEKQLGAHVILVNIVTLMFMIPQGISTAIAVITGNCVGQGDITKAKHYIILCTAFTCAVQFCIILLLFFFKAQWIDLFTHDTHVIKILYSIVPIIIVYLFTDALQMMLGGVVKGVGKQALGSACNFFSYYVIGMVIAFVLGVFKDWHVYGL